MQINSRTEQLRDAGKLHYFITQCVWARLTFLSIGFYHFVWAEYKACFSVLDSVPAKMFPVMEKKDLWLSVVSALSKSLFVSMRCTQCWESASFDLTNGHRYLQLVVLAGCLSHFCCLLNMCTVQQTVTFDRKLELLVLQQQLVTFI